MALSKRDYEVYKSGIDKLVYKYLSRDRTAAASVITTAVDSGADKRKLAEKLTGYADKGLAHKLADKSFQLLEELGVRLKSSSRKRSHKEEPDGGKDGHDKETKKPRTEVQQRVSSPPPAAPLVSSPVSVTLQQKQIQDIMAKAQAAIEERKRALSKIQPQDAGSVPPARVIPATNGAALMPPTIVTPAPSAVNSRIAELQARIRSQIGAVSALPAAAPTPVAGGMVTPLPSLVASHPTLLKPSGERPPPIILDSEGRTLDLTGKEVHITSRAPTLKANIRAKKREEFKQQLAEKPSFDEAPDTEFYDPRVPVRPSHRNHKMNFKFHEQGKFIQLAQRERAKSRLEKLQSEILTAARRTGISSAARLAQMQGEGSVDTTVASVTPAIEWWDAIILEADAYPAQGEEIKAKADYITNLVEHPLEIRCPSDLNKAVALQVFLTAKERKKLRRMNRREAWKEKQDKIRLGLDAPPEAKVRMANLMRVLGTEAVLDPTKMERHVRDQMAKRLRAHEQANAARKLTPQQRKEKRLGKIKEDTSTGVHVSVYRVTNLSNGSHKFKVETNAKQLFMTGAVVLFQDVNVVVVEGGPKQQKKYRQLMMQRIKWVEEARASTNNIEPKCQLVWEGAVLDRNFGEIQFKSCPSESFARDHFKRHNVEHYWDMAYGKKMAEEAELSSPL